jgi:hypothetical protein
MFGVRHADFPFSLKGACENLGVGYEKSRRMRLFRKCTLGSFLPTGRVNLLSEGFVPQPELFIAAAI